MKALFPAILAGVFAAIGASAQAAVSARPGSASHTIPALPFAAALSGAPAIPAQGPTLSLPAPPLPSAPAADRPQAIFDREREFPNHFLTLTGASDPDAAREEDVARARGLMEKALASVFERLVLPMRQEDGSFGMARYFPLVMKKVQATDPRARVMASGGVVRSVIGYLYHVIHERTLADPSVDPRRVLEELIAGEEDLPALQVRGVGSDWDVLVKTQGDARALKDLILRLTNDAEESAGLRETKGDFKRSIFAVGDVKEYDEQTARSVSQGGSAIDFLAFDIESGRLVEPERKPGIVSDLIRGRYRYEAPADAASVEDAAKQTIRGLRPLLELPFLGLADDAILRREIEGLLARDSSEGISAKALGQFPKMVRNARYSGANNRFYRAPPGSLESVAKKLLDQLSSKGGSPLLPEFVDHARIADRRGDHAELNGLPASLLTPVSEFIASRTNGGVLHHGTPSIENGLAVIRQGLFVSKDGQGTAVYGRGGYTSADESMAQGYAGQEGVVFALKVKDDARLNVLDWQRVQGDPAIQRIEQKARERGEDVFQTLARDHGIDVILNQYVLLQNTDAVEFPQDLSGLVAAYSSLIRNAKADARSRVSALDSYGAMYLFATAMGVRGLSPPEQESASFWPGLIDALMHPETLEPAQALELGLVVSDGYERDPRPSGLPPLEVFRPLIPFVMRLAAEAALRTGELALDAWKRIDLVEKYERLGSWAEVEGTLGVVAALNRSLALSFIVDGTKPGDFLPWNFVEGHLKSQTTAALIDLLGRPDVRNRFSVMIEISHRTLDRAERAALEPFLDDVDRSVRVRVAAILAAGGTSHRAVAILRELLSAPWPEDHTERSDRSYDVNSAAELLKQAAPQNAQVQQLAAFLLQSGPSGIHAAFRILEGVSASHPALQLALLSFAEVENAQGEESYLKSQAFILLMKAEFHDRAVQLRLLEGAKREPGGGDFHRLLCGIKDDLIPEIQMWALEKIKTSAPFSKGWAARLIAASSVTPEARATLTDLAATGDADTRSITTQLLEYLPPPR